MYKSDKVMFRPRSVLLKYIPFAQTNHSKPKWEQPGKDRSYPDRDFVLASWLFLRHKNQA
jgi:hypothetical protein